MGSQHSNWEILAGAAAGVAGGILGTAYGKHIKLLNAYSNINNSPLVKETTLQTQNALNDVVSFDNVKFYVVNNNEVDWKGKPTLEGNVILNRALIKDYEDFRATVAHELYHVY
jgi:hypothetical protein